MEDLIIKRVTNSGVIVEDPEPEDYLGGISSPLIPPSIIFKDGHGHLKYQGRPEMQFNRNFDTFSCVLFTIAKGLCYYLKERYKISITISEMYNAFFAGVVNGKGTSVRSGMESFRKWGWVEDSVYPLTPETTLKQFQQMPSQIIIKQGKDKLTKWNFHWEVLEKDHDSIINNLQRTVVLLVGFAWAYKDGIYYTTGDPANHMFTGVDYKDNKNIIVDDSYPRDNRYDNDSTPDEFIKELDASYKFSGAYRCWLTPVNTPPKNFSLTNIINSMFSKIVRSTTGGLFFVKDGKKQKIDDYLALAGAIIDEVGCETINEEKLVAIPDYKFFGK